MLFFCPFIVRDQALGGAKRCLFQYQNLETRTRGQDKTVQSVFEIVFLS